MTDLKSIKRQKLEDAVCSMIQPAGDQYPRPWMTMMSNPEEANIFTIGKHPSTKYLSRDIDKKEHFNSLFNNPPMSCHDVYHRIRPKGNTPTRQKLEIIKKKLNSKSLEMIIDTNVSIINYDSIINRTEQSAAKSLGEEGFLDIVKIICPKVLIAYGDEANAKISDLFNIKLHCLPKTSDDRLYFSQGLGGEFCEKYKPWIFFTPPLWDSNWGRWAEKRLDELCREIARLLS
jgi:hypothetical protein